MQIKKLELENFRNYETLSVEFGSGTNIIYGENGQGKTNILESVYMCGTGRSHKRSRENEIIRHGCGEAHVKAEFSGEEKKRRVDIHLRTNKTKGIAVNKVPIRKLSELYGKIPIVIFSAEDLDIIKRGPSERRNFMDSELCQIDPVYVENLIGYNRILKQRRELFKRIEENKEDAARGLDLLEAWDLQLVSCGSVIIEKRRRFIDEINSVMPEIHSGITKGRERTKLSYEPSVREGDFYETLLRNRERDRILKQTCAGPHRDDFSFYNGSDNMKMYGSSGQQRTCALTLKLSEIKLIEKKKRKKPVLLLDDVLSELDRSRQKTVIGAIRDTQTLITCAGIDEFVEKETAGAEKFYIKDGRAEHIS